MSGELRHFFETRAEGNGLWKWDHYLEVYERHFSRFWNATEINLLEIGIFSGGGLDMWRWYFGDKLKLFGVDIAPECKAYEADGVQVFIGDQSKSAFWEEFKAATPPMDIVIDDGSHKPRHQRTTFGALWPHIAPGGVYVCEDIHGYPRQPFAEYIHDMAHGLHHHEDFERSDNPNRSLIKKANTIQAEISSISIYPYMIVVEKNSEPVTELIARKRGTIWQPFRP